MPITPVSQLVAKAKAQITTLSLDEARRASEENRALLVDIRDIRELQKTGRIPGALHAPRGMLEFWVDPQSPYHRDVFATDRPIVLFCASAWRSALATKTLQDMKMDNVAEMEGGFSAWQKAGYPVDRD